MGHNCKIWVKYDRLFIISLILGTGQSDSSGLVNSVSGEEEEEDENVFDPVDQNESAEGQIQGQKVDQKVGQKLIKNAIFSPTAGRRRSRQQSTSLMRHPIEDDNLKDYHEHRLTAGKDPMDISYNLYSMVVSLIFLFLIASILLLTAIKYQR